jgi:hypothetical protein
LSIFVSGLRRDAHSDGFSFIFPIILYGNYQGLVDIFLPCIDIPVVPHKAVAEVSKIATLQERQVVVMHGWQTEPTDGLKDGWSCVI